MMVIPATVEANLYFRTAAQYSTLIHRERKVIEEPDSGLLIDHILRYAESGSGVSVPQHGSMFEDHRLQKDPLGESSG